VYQKPKKASGGGAVGAGKSSYQQKYTDTTGRTAAKKCCISCSQHLLKNEQLAYNGKCQTCFKRSKAA